MLKVDQSLLQFGSVSEDLVSLGMISSTVPNEPATPFVNMVLKLKCDLYLILLDYDIWSDCPEKSGCCCTGEEPTKFGSVLWVPSLVMVDIDTSAKTLPELENRVRARHTDKQVYIVVGFPDDVCGDGAFTIEESGCVDYKLIHDDSSMLQGGNHTLEYITN
jgi:hypothetical protein